MEILYEGPIVGISFEPQKSNIGRIVNLINVTDIKYPKTHLKHNPKNKYDSNAIEIYIEDMLIGYIPKTHNLNILRIGLDRVVCQIVKSNLLEEETVGFTIRAIEIPF